VSYRLPSPSPLPDPKRTRRTNAHGSFPLFAHMAVRAGEASRSLTGLRAASCLLLSTVSMNMKKRNVGSKIPKQPRFQRRWRERLLGHDSSSYSVTIRARIQPRSLRPRVPQIVHYVIDGRHAAVDSPVRTVRKPHSRTPSRFGFAGVTTPKHCRHARASDIDVRCCGLAEIHCKRSFIIQPTNEHFGCQRRTPPHETRALETVSAGNGQQL
jgi:hypothetical protein